MLPVGCKLDELVQVLLLDDNRKLSVLTGDDDCAILTELIGLHVVYYGVDVY